MQTFFKQCHFLLPCFNDDKKGKTLRDFIGGIGVAIGSMHMSTPRQPRILPFCNLDENTQFMGWQGEV
jgi:hypothetical protein